MNEKKETDTTQAKSKKPTWWNDSLETSWKKVSMATVAAWDKLGHAAKKIEHHSTEQALAFGHGAREAYPKMLVWSHELEEKLKSDWKQVQSDATDAWEQVHDAIKYSWNAATHGHMKS